MIDLPAIDDFLDRYAEIADSFSDEQINFRINLLNTTLETLNKVPNLNHNLFRHTI